MFCSVFTDETILYSKEIQCFDLIGHHLRIKPEWESRVAIITLYKPSNYFWFRTNPSLNPNRMSQRKCIQIRVFEPGQCGICPYINVTDMNEEICVSIIHTSFPAAHIISETQGLNRPWHIRIVSYANIGSSISGLRY